LLDGVKDGYLVNPVVADARTEITTELLSEKGYSLIVENEEGVEEEQTFFQKDFERKFFSEKQIIFSAKHFWKTHLKTQLAARPARALSFVSAKIMPQNHSNSKSICRPTLARKI